MRVDHIEECADIARKQISDNTKAYNDMVSAFEQQSQELRYLQVKMVDLENRLLRKNITFCGIPESIKPAELNIYLQHPFL